MNTTELLEQLRNNTMEISFTKVNGETRVMECTLRKDILPKVDGTLNPDRKERPEGLISVWDLKQSGWRSFYTDKVTDIKVCNK